MREKYIAFAVDFSVFCRAWRALHYWVACEPSTYYRRGGLSREELVAAFPSESLKGIYLTSGRHVLVY